jgi:Flp pilus assembly pilin Flp
MLYFLKRFLRREEGAITVDWVVLTAAVSGLAIAFIVQLKDDASSLSALTRDYLAAQDPAAAAGGNIQGTSTDTE